jgi:hemolysin III
MAEISAPKPSLRGISHAIACFFAAAAGVWLLQLTRTERAHGAVAIYVATLVLMFAVSAIYHLPNWSPGIRQWWRRADHAAIFTLIAGTATPFCQLALPPEAGQKLLATMWIGATLGTAQSLFWVRAPKALSAVVYVIVGSLAFPYLPEFFRALGTGGVTLILIGGFLYTVGAVVYSLKRPNPFPRVFGYHEIFHLLVIAASVVHFVAVYEVVRGI